MRKRKKKPLGPNRRARRALRHGWAKFNHYERASMARFRRYHGF